MPCNSSVHLLCSLQRNQSLGISQGVSSNKILTQLPTFLCCDLICELNNIQKLIFPDTFILARFFTTVLLSCKEVLLLDVSWRDSSSCLCLVLSSFGPSLRFMLSDLEALINTWWIQTSLESSPFPPLLGELETVCLAIDVIDGTVETTLFLYVDYVCQ